MTGYAETYRRSLERPEEFWAEAAEAIDWERRWDRVLDERPAAVLPLVSRARGSTPAGTRSTATSRRARRAGRADLRQPGHRQRSSASPIASCATGWRVSPACWPGSGSAAATAC